MEKTEREGFDRVTFSAFRTIPDTEGGAESGALYFDPMTLEPELRHVVKAWGNLPPSIRDAIVALIRPYVTAPDPAKS